MADLLFRSEGFRLVSVKPLLGRSESLSAESQSIKVAVDVSETFGKPDFAPTEDQAR